MTKGARRWRPGVSPSRYLVRAGLGRSVRGAAHRAVTERLEIRVLLSVDLVTDHPLGTQGSNPTGMVELNGTGYFVASAPAPGLWKTDGTAGGTTLVKLFNGIDQPV